MGEQITSSQSCKQFVLGKETALAIQKKKKDNIKQRGKSFTIYLIAYIKTCSSYNNHCIALMFYRISTVPFLCLALTHVGPDSIA